MDRFVGEGEEKKNGERITEGHDWEQEARGRALEGPKRKKFPTYFSAPKWPELG